ncbi:GTPase IMAP family member 9-like [Aulostomus maculatus]
MAYSNVRTTPPAHMRHTDLKPREEIRIVLTGRTGNGKSASGNTILNRKAFTSVMSPSSVTTECEKAKGTAGGYKVAVIDTPGLHDTKYKLEEVVRKLKMCLSLAAPGPHVFLIVISLNRFTKEEQESVELLQQVFGERAADYSFVLFTHGDQLGYRIEEFIVRCPRLSLLIQKCHGRYHVFNNVVTNTDQVSQLLNKIIRMVNYNGGMYYTNAMFQEAERAIQEQVRKILAAKAEAIHREKEKLRARLEGEQLQTQLRWLDDDVKARSREKAEKKNKFIETGMVVTSAEAGVMIGSTAAAAGGPVCMGVGAVVGGAVGALVGLISPAVVKVLKNKCSVQ